MRSADDEDILTWVKVNRNPVARKLRDPEFKQRIVPEYKQYNRKKVKMRDWYETQE